MTVEQHKYSFKIEQKPEGGYILRSEHPPLVIEGATKEEVEEKLKAEFMKLMPEGIAKKLIELSKMAGVSVKTNVNFKINPATDQSVVRFNSTTDQSVSNLTSEPMLSGAPKEEPVISPKLIIILLLLLGLALMIWRILPHR